MIGSGAFVASEENPGTETVLAARKDHDCGPANLAHQGRAPLDEVRVLVVPEDFVRIGAPFLERADLVRQIQAHDEGRIETAGFNLFAPPTRGIDNSVVFRPDNPLEADVRVRRALLHGTDTARIVETPFSAKQPHATSMLSSRAQGYVDLSERLAFDPALTASLLDEAGWTLGPDGPRAKDGVVLVLGAYESLPWPQDRAALQLVAQQWGGVALNVLPGEADGAMIDNLDPAKTPVTLAMVGRAAPDVIRSHTTPPSATCSCRSAASARRWTASRTARRSAQGPAGGDGTAAGPLDWHGAGSGGLVPAGLGRGDRAGTLRAARPSRADAGGAPRRADRVGPEPRRRGRGAPAHRHCRPRQGPVATGGAAAARPGQRGAARVRRRGTAPGRVDVGAM